MEKDKKQNDNEKLLNPSDTDDVLAGDEDKRKKIRDALLIIDPESSELSKQLAAVYEGLVLTFNNKRNPDRISLAAHSARELTSILPKYFKGMPLPVLDEKVQPSQEQKNDNQRQILEDLLTKHPERNALPDYLKKKFVDNWMEINSYFLKHCHHHDLKNRELTGTTDKEFDAYIWRYEDLLYQLLVERTFFDELTEIDHLLAIENPSSENISELTQHISQPEHRRYFFQKCANANWLEPLKNIKAFSNPQEPIREGGYIRFVEWPESQYLSRIADRKPKEVFEIINNLDTTNQSVLDDFVDAAIKSSTDIAASYVGLICKKKWIQNPYNFRLPDKLADLIVKLAEGNKFDDAIKLTRALFNTKVDPPIKTSHDPGLLGVIHPDAKTYFDSWQLGEMMKKKLGLLANQKPVEFFRVLASSLRQVLELEKRTNSEDSFYEYSHIWRPNLMLARRRSEDPKNLFLDGLINLIEQNKNKEDTLGGFVEILKKHPWALFRRIEMLLYSVNPTFFTKESEGILSDKKVIIAYNLRREYVPLLGKRFKDLSEAARKSILEIIKQGPDITKTDDMSEEQFKRVQDNWRNIYLNPIKDLISEKERDDYQSIFAKYNEPIDDDGEIKTWDGGKSPLSTQELSDFSGPKTIEYLGTYEEPDDFFSAHSTGGLGMAFAGVVTENPSKYIEVISEFAKYKIRPIYLYHFINGLKEAAKKNNCFEWTPVIQLCHDAIVNQENKLASITPNKHEQDWQSVKRVIADFLGEVLGRNICEIPITLKDQVWEIISDLTEDSEPTKEYEEKDTKGGWDPMTLAINTTRGEAMHALVNYGLWYARNLADKSVEIKMPPEMESVLNKHLDISRDPSLAIRSVYGWRLPNLFYLNKPWVEKNKGKIFDKNRKEYFLAAWEGYLANGVIKEVFAILEEQYRNFIPFLGTIEKAGYRAADVEQRFPQHLMIVYMNEDGHDDLIKYFFEAAPAKDRAEAINFAGRVILREIAGLPDKEKERNRLSQLWNQRIGQESGKIEVEELKEFGWWFKNSPLEKKENLSQLIKTLEVTKGKIDVPYEIVEELKSYVSEFPMESITILDSIARSDKEHHEVSYKKEEFRDIIKLVKTTGNEEAIKIADALINYLGSIGFIDDFRNLLN